MTGHKLSDLKSRVFKLSLCLAHQVKLVLVNLTVEPAVVVRSFSHGLTLVTENQILIYKSCRIDFNASDETCHNLFAKENKALNNEISDKVTHTIHCCKPFLFEMPGT